MRQRIDLVGQRFGRLTILGKSEFKPDSSIWWDCLCDCGKETKAPTKALLGGRKKSCGCLETENKKAIRNRGGCDITHGASKSRLYRIWWAMKTRCYNPNHKNYPNYGGRGIEVCDEWLHNYSAFSAWAFSHGYADNLSIDRIDVNGNYTPGNCKWATDEEQRRNKRSTKHD